MNPHYSDEELKFMAETFVKPIKPIAATAESMREWGCSGNIFGTSWKLEYIAPDNDNAN